jgi:tRNA 2-thiocytidine biosynthesis protein TtcA
MNAALPLPLAEPQPLTSWPSACATRSAKAIADFGMIEDGDKVMVCLSGGKDSYTMLDILLQLQKKAPVRFDHRGEPGPEAAGLPRARAAHLPARAIGVDFHIIEQDTYSVVSRVVPEGKTMCSLCSRLRRGALYTYAERERLHQDRAGPPPRRPGGHLLPQPVLPRQAQVRHAAEAAVRRRQARGDPPAGLRARNDIAAYAEAKQFPIIPCNLCGSQENLQRKQVKKMMAQWEKRFAGTHRDHRARAGRHPSLAVERPEAVRLPARWASAAMPCCPMRMRGWQAHEGDVDAEA